MTAYHSACQRLSLNPTGLTPKTVSEMAVVMSLLTTTIVATTKMLSTRKRRRNKIGRPWSDYRKECDSPNGDVARSISDSGAGYGDNSSTLRDVLSELQHIPVVVEDREFLHAPVKGVYR